MTLENINKALQHPFKIRDPTTLTLKTITDAVLANLTSLKDALAASTFKIAELETSLTSLTTKQSSLLASLELEMEVLRYEVVALQAQVLELKTENEDMEKQIVALDGAVSSFATGFKAVTLVYKERARKAGGVGDALPSPARFTASPTKFL